MNNEGFTLVEIMVALFVFVILGTIAAVGLHTVIQTHRHLQQMDEQLQKLQVLMTLLRRDMSQIVNRGVIGITGETLPAFLVDKANHIEFTTGGYTNPLSAEKRSSLQRVAYEWNGDALVRLTWSVLDRAPGSKALERTLLTQVKKLHIDFIDRDGNTVPDWPPNNGAWINATQNVLPKALLLTLTLSSNKTLYAVFPIVGRGFYEK